MRSVHCWVSVAAVFDGPSPGGVEAQATRPDKARAIRTVLTKGLCVMGASYSIT